MYKFKDVYDARWSASYGTFDDDILALDRPRTQVEFFYLNYNRFIADQIVRHLGGTKGKKLLELGCGRATASIYQALKLGMDVHPTDYSEEALRIADKNMKKYGVTGQTRQADLYAMPFEDGSFDAIISLGVMEHIEDPGRAYREMHRLLKEGGVMISMNIPERPLNIQRVAVPVNRALVKIETVFKKKNSKPWLDKQTRSKTSSVYRSFLDGEGFKRVVEESGFRNAEVFQANPFPSFDPLSKGLDWLVVKFYSLTLFFRRAFGGMQSPFLSSERNARVHFIVATK